MILMTQTNGEELAEIRKTLALRSRRAMAALLGVTEARYTNWEYDKARTPNDILIKARGLLQQNDVGAPRIPASLLKIRVPYIGQVAASLKVDWSDPFDTEAFEYVPPEMGDARGRFAARVIGISMLPLLMPGDLCVFQSSNIPKLGIVVMHRTNDNLITVKTLRHDGKEFMLHSLNADFDDVRAEGTVIGHLVGIVREQGSRVTTEYDPSGIRP